MDRRTFLASGGAAAFGTLVPSISRSFLLQIFSEPFAWKANDLIFSFEVTAGKIAPKAAGTVGAREQELTNPPASKSHCNAAEKILPIRA